MDQLLEQALEYLRGMWRRRFAGLAAAWLVALAGVVIVFAIPDRYQASARLFVDTQSVLKPLMAGLTVQPNVTQQVIALSRTLLSRPNLEKLVRMADLDVGRHAGSQDALVDQLVRDIKLQGGKDNIYTITYQDQDANRAKRAVESLLSIFVESGLGKKRRDNEKAQQFLQGQIQDYEAKLARAERRLKDFRLKNLQLLGGRDSVSNMMELDAQIAQARTEHRAATQARDALKRQLEGEEPVFLPEPGAPAASSSDGTAVEGVPDLDRRIASLERELDDLLRRFTERHPDVISAQRQLGDLKREREAKLDERRKQLALAAADRDKAPAAPTPRGAERNPVYQQLKVSLADAESNVAALQARVQDLEARYNQIRATARLRPELEEELAALNRDYQVHKTNYEGLVQRRESAQLTGELDETAGVADFRVIDPPRVSPKPVWPDRPLLLGAVIVLSLAAGIAVAFATSQLFPTFFNTQALQHMTQRPVLGVVSVQPNPTQRRVRRRRAVMFAGATGGLFALYGAAFFLLRVLAPYA
jgi:polysaccharide chain length determinant protein (PEP-CTERM system associated)